MLQLNGDHQLRYAGYYVAQTAGYYREAGLDVTITATTRGGRDAIAAVAAGRADFGIGAANILVARDRGVPLVVLAVIFQKSPFVLYARKDAGLSSVRDLDRLSLWRPADERYEPELSVMLRSFNISLPQVTGEGSASGVALLAAGTHDVVPGISLSAPYDARRAGLDVVSLSLASQGIDIPGDSLFTHESLIAQDPDLVERFVLASLKGWRDALARLDEVAMRITKDQLATSSGKSLLGINFFQIPLIQDLAMYPVVDVGSVNTERWRRIHETLREYNLVQSDFDIDRAIFDPVRRLRRRGKLVEQGLLFTVPAVGLLILGLVVWSQSLRRAVERATSAYREEHASLTQSENRFRALYEDNPSMFFTLDPDGIVQSVNSFGARQLGYLAEELVGSSCEKLYDGQHSGEFRERLAKSLEQPDQVERWELRKIRKDGTLLWARETARVVRDESGCVSILLVGEDITDARELSEQLSHQASHDSLTGLANRREFERRLNQVLNTARADGSEHALCYLDLDQFKVVNDTCGHLAGDELLRQLSGTLRRCVRKRDTLARLGGDEFGVLVEDCDLPQARRIADALLKAVKEVRFQWEDKSFTLGMSIGLVPIDAKDVDVGRVLRAADSACYAAKDQGRNRIHVYHEDDEALSRREGEMQWVSRIEDALERDRFCLYYQPIVTVEKSKQHSLHYELLLRMLDDDGDIIPPGAFLPAAERYNLSSRVDRWVVEHAFDWLEANPRHLKELGVCSINLSGITLGDEGFQRDIAARLTTGDVPPAKICFESTETAVITNLSSATQFITALKRLGCQFSLDDFGSGLSSFAYLKHLQVDYLKIDGLFVKEILDDPIDLAMVRSINEMGHVMGKHTIAEFVESDAVLQILQGIGVDFAQGYGIGKPRPIAELGDANYVGILTDTPIERYG